MTTSVMKFNVFHYLLYSKRMNTLNKECWSKCEKKRAGMFVREEVFHQGASITVLRMKRRHCREPWRRHKLYAPRAQFYCTGTATTQRQTHKSHQCNENTCAANFCHSRGILENMFVYKATFSKLHGCHCTLFKPLHSGIDVTVPRACVSLSVSRQQIKLSRPRMLKHSS